MQSYPTLSEYLKNTFNKKMVKLPIDGGFSCPNRENGNSGCLFCSEKGSGDFTFGHLSIEEQIKFQKDRYFKSGKADENTSYIAYFQNFTNTYANPDALKKKYDQALSCNGIDGLAIATRSDCIDDPILLLLKQINQQTHLWVELGFQTSNQHTVKIINRGYENIIFDECMNRLNNFNIKTVAHVIFGLPFETFEDYMNTIKHVKNQNLWGIKIHSLYIEYDSKMFEFYNEHPFDIMTMDQYTDAVCEALKILDNQVIIHRLTGDCDKKLLFEPKWSADKLKVLSEINRKVSKRTIYT